MQFRHVTFGNPFNPVAPTGLKLRLRPGVPSYSRYSMTSTTPVASGAVGTPWAEWALVSDPVHQPRPTEPPHRRSVSSRHAPKRVVVCSVSRSEYPHPHSAPQFQASLDPMYSPSTAIPNSSHTSEMTHSGTFSRSGGSSRIPSRLPSSRQQWAPVDSVNGRYAKHQGEGNGQSRSVLSVAQQEQHRDQAQALSYGREVVQANAAVPQLLEGTYGNSQIYAAPGHNHHPYAPAGPHKPMRSPPMQGAPIYTAPSPCTSGGSTQGCYSAPATCIQPMQVDHSALLTQATATCQAHGSTGLYSIGVDLIPQVIPTKMAEYAPTGASSGPPGAGSGFLLAGFTNVAGGHVPVSAAASQVSPGTTLPFRGDDLSATGDVFNFCPLIPLNYSLHTAHFQPEGSLSRVVGGNVNPCQPEAPSNTLLYNQSPVLPISAGHRPSRDPPNPTLSSPDPSSYIPLPLLQADLSASGDTPNSGAGLSGVGTGIGTGKPTSVNQQIGPDRSDKAHARRVLKPYQRLMPSVPHKTPAVKHEGDLERLQQRCKEQGADEGAMALLGKVFVSGVSSEALTRPLTDEEVETGELGVSRGQVYNAFLNYLIEGESITPRYACRLCQSSQTWKHSKDVLRHLRRNHFGLAYACEKWYVLCIH